MGSHGSGCSGCTGGSSCCCSGSSGGSSGGSSCSCSGSCGGCDTRCTSSCKGLCDNACTAENASEVIANLVNTIKENEVISAQKMNVIRNYLNNEYQRRKKTDRIPLVSNNQIISSNIDKQLINGINSLSNSSNQLSIPAYNILSASPYANIVSKLQLLMSTKVNVGK